jgi:peptidyl-prolyl cis-trans isomerase C
MIASPAFAQNVATVNGKPITKKSVEQFVNLLVTRGATKSAQLEDQVKKEMINRLILIQAAEKAGISTQPDIQTEIELARQSILVRALMSNYLQKNPITEAQIQDEYNRLKQQQAGKLEYHVQHILVPDEKKAKDILKDIQNGKKFADAAKEESQDPGSAEKGGDLGWAPATNYVEPFQQAIMALKKGQLIDAPVRTQYGWHIIKVLDTRPIELPTLDKLRPQVEEILRQKLLANYQKQLRDKAKIQEKL